MSLFETSFCSWYLITRLIYNDFDKAYYKREIPTAFSARLPIFVSRSRVYSTDTGTEPASRASHLNVYPRPAWHHRRTEEGWITYFKEKIFDILWLWNIIHKTKWLKNWKNQRKASHLNVYPRPAWHHRKTEEGWITYFKENILTFYDFGILWTKIIEKLEERSTSLIKIL